MKIRIANSAGFCYGVRRAVELAEGAARSGEPCVMLGPIIHNQDMMDHLARHGLRAVVRPEEVPEGSEVIIRSHGESRAVHEGLHARGVSDHLNQEKLGGVREKSKKRVYKRRIF